MSLLCEQFCKKQKEEDSTTSPIKMTGMDATWVVVFCFLNWTILRLNCAYLERKISQHTAYLLYRLAPEYCEARGRKEEEEERDCTKEAEKEA